MINWLMWPHQHNHLNVILKVYYDLQILTFYYVYLLRYVLLKLKKNPQNLKFQMPINQPWGVREQNIIRFLIFIIDVTYKLKITNIGDIVV